MNLKILCISILAVMFALPSICFSEKPDPNVWEYYVTDGKGRACYYNKTNMNKSSDIISVWVYTTITDADKKEAIDRAKEVEDYKMEMLHTKYDHENTLFEIDCRNKKFSIKEAVEFDDKGNVIDQFQYSNFLFWLDINPADLKVEKLFNMFCTKQEKADQKK